MRKFISLLGISYSMTFVLFIYLFFTGVVSLVDSCGIFGNLMTPDQQLKITTFEIVLLLLFLNDWGEYREYRLF